MRSFKQLFYADPRTWKREELQKLSAKQLQVFLKLLGTGSSGKKKTMVNRILKIIQIRNAIAFYELKPNRLASNYTKKRLSGMCKTAGCWQGKNKIQAATSLCNWAMESRRKGKEFLRECKNFITSKPKQLSLNLDTNLCQNIRK